MIHPRFVRDSLPRRFYLEGVGRQQTTTPPQRLFGRFRPQSTTTRTHPSARVSCSVLVPVLNGFVQTQILPQGMSVRSRFGWGVVVLKKSLPRPPKWWLFLHHYRNHPHPSHYEAPTLQPCHPTPPTIVIDPTLGTGGVGAALVARNTANKARPSIDEGSSNA